MQSEERNLATFNSIINSEGGAVTGLAGGDMAGAETRTDAQSAERKLHTLLFDRNFRSPDIATRKLANGIASSSAFDGSKLVTGETRINAQSAERKLVTGETRINAQSAERKLVVIANRNSILIVPANMVGCGNKSEAQDAQPKGISVFLLQQRQQQKSQRQQ